jgi:hypothetical protein
MSEMSKRPRLFTVAAAAAVAVAATLGASTIAQDQTARVTSFISEVLRDTFTPTDITAPAGLSPRPGGPPSTVNLLLGVGGTPAPGAGTVRPWNPADQFSTTP